jgi:hypothetical protein
MNGEMVWLLRQRGICSIGGCGEPIAGWCETCDSIPGAYSPKLCERHLMEHLNMFAHQPYYYPYYYPHPFTARNEEQ